MELVGQAGIIGVLLYVLRYIVKPMIDDVKLLSVSAQKTADRLESMEKANHLIVAALIHRLPCIRDEDRANLEGEVEREDVRHPG